MVNNIIDKLLFPLRWIKKTAINIWGHILTIPRTVQQSPVKTYHSIVNGRNWVLAKIEYLQSESQKWATAFKILKMPYSLLRMLGLSPQMATSLLVAGSVAGGGVVVNETLLSERSFSRGDPGIYAAPLDVPVSYVEGQNTLRLDLGSTPIGEIFLDSITVGTAYTGSALPSGESNAVVIGGLPTVADPAFTETYLEVGEMTVDRWRCTQLKLDNIEAHTLNLKWNASDGQSISPVAGTPRNRAIGGGNRADSMKTSGGYYDQIKLTAATSGVNGKVDVLRLSNLYTKGGPCILSRIKVGTLNIIFNEIGAGDGFAAKDFIVATSVIYKILNNVDNVEVAISPP
jgi:hypothetical protein